MRIAFTIPGDPQPWRRGRLGQLPNGKPRHFKDAKTKANQQNWAAAALEALDGAPPLEGGVVAHVVCRFMPPKSLTKARRAAIESGVERPTKRPDSDNVAKNLDGLNGVAFRDDAQVVRLIVDKVYATSAGVDVTIEPFIPE